MLQTNQEHFSSSVEVLLKEELDKLQGKSVGLITNPTGVDPSLNSIVDVLYHHPDVNLVSLYGPEHGVRGSEQAGEYVEFYTDERTGLPVYSLYGETRKPTPEMLDGVDVLVFDIQDVGTRFYTYIYTMAYAMEAAAENNVEFIVLDRPNPIGGVKVEGPVLEPSYESFVGLYPIPLRHGMTVGELALLFNEEFDIGADLSVIEMMGWKRSMYYDDTTLSWVLPSPNIPTLDTATVYSGPALMEGTNVSEGRGTTKPFELIGAPFIDGVELAEKLNDIGLRGVQFRSAYFTPQFSKHAGELSGGIQIHITDRTTYQPVKTGLTIVKTIHDMYPEDFEFRKENNKGVSFFDHLIGNGWVRESMENGVSVETITENWQQELEDFKKIRRAYLLYKTSAQKMIAMVEHYEYEDVFTSDDIAVALKRHLTVVDHFENNGSADKVAKHIVGFKLLLNHHYENAHLSAEAYRRLMDEAESMTGQWG
ncbi:MULTISPECIES: DUF1343 domain-containing protein [Clostridia]|uniref:exo-beta-N-acetylmuramidase NamZ family protein n=1 Tax=Clostridia TaxID=186801 RepID=UPI000EA2E1C2|nr:MULTISPECIES: DUF1343 domain-containing protein [Clostridia]NBJ71381.1 DUF1343 domain-containing protein [Roseburia sp. 1XD42-34]RKI74470.1 DUF1343 domain-containing protein [Clostridium sp. 1xD42-85]